MTKQPTACTCTNSIIIVIVIIIIIISVLHARRPPTLITCSLYDYKIGHWEAPVLAKRTNKQTIKTKQKETKKVITIYFQTQQNVLREQLNPPLILTNKELTHIAMLVKLIINSNRNIMLMFRTLVVYIFLTDRSITFWLIRPIKSAKRVLYHERMIAINKNYNLIIHSPYEAFQG